MMDFVAIRRRAEHFQEEAPLGSDMYALTQDVLELLGEVKRQMSIIARLDDAEKERDEAREIHAKVCAQYAEAVVERNTLAVQLDAAI
jgi:F0F1-type ATP synthase membrane subunit b/b'